MSMRPSIRSKRLYHFQYMKLANIPFNHSFNNQVVRALFLSHLILSHLTLSLIKDLTNPMVDVLNKRFRLIVDGIKYERDLAHQAVEITLDKHILLVC